MKTYDRFEKLLVFVCILSLAFSFSSPKPANAAIPSLSVTPATQTALTCDETIVVIRMADVVNLYGYDITISLTSSIAGTVNIIEVTNGTFLDSGGYYHRKVIDNTAGTIRVAYNQNSPSLPKSGSGDLVIIRLQAQTPGVTVNVNITASTLSTINGIPISHVRYNGTLTTSDACPQTLLYIEPQIQSVCLIGDATVIKVKVRYAIDLWGYALDLVFDPAAVEIESVQNGGFLDSSYLYQGPYVNEVDGRITVSLDYTQVAPSLPKTGSGDILIITLRATEDHLNRPVNVTISSTSELVDYEMNPENPVLYTPSGATLYTNTCSPTAVNLLAFDVDRAKKSAVVTWETASETNNSGFNLYRSTSPDGEKVQLNSELIPTNTYPGSATGAEYTYTDDHLRPKQVYYYWLEFVSVEDERELFGPITATYVKP